MRISRRKTMGAAVAVLLTAVLLVGPDAASAAPARGSDPVGAYVYQDERAPGGPTFTFRNAPNVLAFAGGNDDGEANVNLPFAFEFYGVNRPNMTVSPNGAVVFPSAQQVSFVNQAFTNPVANQAMIAPAWDDWVIVGQVSTGLTGASPNRVFTVHWDDVRPFVGPGSDAVDFQMQLYEAGDRIEFHYLDVESNAGADRGVGATVGIDNGTTSALQYSLNQTSLINGRAIRFSPVRCNGLRATITGTFGPDAIPGTAGNDVIVSLSGNDSVTSGAGNDVVCLGDGNDQARLGGGNDKAFGGKGNDALRGRGGNDLLDGGRNADSLRGGPGSDVCKGRAGFDTAAGCEAVGGVP